MAGCAGLYRGASYDNEIKKLEEIEEKDRIRNFQPPVSGQDIMETFGIEPSSIVGQIKEAIKEAILDGKIENDRSQAWKMMIQLAAEHGLSPVDGAQMPQNSSE